MVALDTKQHEQASCGQKIKELREIAERDGWSDEQREEFDKHLQAYNDITDEIEKIKQDEERLRKSVAITERVEASQRERFENIPTVTIEGENPDAPQRITAATKQLALRAWMARGVQDGQLINPVDKEEALQAARDIGLEIDPTNDKAQVNARCLNTSEYMLPHCDANGLHYRKRTPRFIQDVFEKRAMGSKQTNAGAEHVPDETMQQLENAMLAFGSVRSLATVIRTEGAGPMPVPTANDTANEGVIVDENSAAADVDIPTNQVVLGHFQWSSGVIKMNQSLIWDPGVDSMALAMESAMTRIARGQNRKFTVGAGTTEPRGVTLDAADSGIALATANAPTYDEIVDIATSLEPAYEGNATWMFAKLVLGGIQKIRSTTGEAPLWQPSLVPGAPATILGRPYQVNQHMPTAATGSAKCILYGDFSKYYIRDQRDVYLVRLVERYAELNAQAIIAWSFSDGALVDAGTGPIVFAAGPAS